jgi:serine/threonine-protein kinase RsbW
MRSRDMPIQLIAYLRKLRLSLGPDSYFRYKRDRKYERREAERAREHAHAVELEVQEAQRDAERERGYRQRYEREVAREETGRPDGAERTPHVDRRFQAQPDSVADARRFVRGWLHASMRGDDVLIGDVVLAVSEACTNVVVHAYRDGPADGDAFRVVAERDGPAILVSVSDEGHGMTPRRDRPGLGLGLPLIASLADSVDVGAPAGGGRGTVVEMRFNETG